MDGPNFEQVFRKMQALHGGNPEDVKIIVRYLRFFKGTDEYARYADHYLPMLSPDVAKEFAQSKAEEKSEASQREKTDEIVEKKIVEEVKVEEKIVEKPITKTVATKVKRGRLSSK